MLGALRAERCSYVRHERWGSTQAVELLELHVLSAVAAVAFVALVARSTGGVK